LAVVFKFLLFREIDTFSFIPPLWGSDGGLYGFYAKEILDGRTVGFDAEHSPAYLLAFIVKTFSVSLDRVLFYLPVFLSSLSVVPVILIGYAYNLVPFSFFAALIGSVTYAYYIRSFLGYYDTDALNVFFSLCVVAFMILTVEKKKKIYLVATALSLLLFYMWYHSSKLIILVLILNFALYLIIWQYRVLLQRKKLLITLFFVLVGFVLLYHQEIGVFATRANAYIFKAKNIYLTQQNNHTLIFNATLQTVGEAKALPIQKLGQYLSINNVYFYLSLVALLLFTLRFRSFLLSFSLLFLGLLSLQSGIRFSEYGVYIMAFGAVYILYIIRNILIIYFGLGYRYAQAVFIVLFMLLLGAYLQKIVHKNSYLHPVLHAKSVELLRNLDRELNEQDYILTWWDYGWPLWYYTKANTLIDNGKHFEDNYIISKLLFAKQDYTAKAAKYFLQKCNGKRCYLSRMLFKKKSPAEIDAIIKQSDIKAPDKAVYFLFHARMVKILRVIATFSNRDPQSGILNKKLRLHIVKVGGMHKGIVISQQAKIKLDLKKRRLSITGKKLPLKEIYIVNNHKIIQLETRYTKSKFHAILFNKKYIILCNDYVFNSFFIQAMVLNNYDKKYFTLVGQSDEIKILQLK